MVVELVGRSEHEFTLVYVCRHVAVGAVSTIVKDYVVLAARATGK